MTNPKESHLADILPHGGQLFVGGDWVKPSSDALIDVVMPSTEEIFFRVAGADGTDINRAVAAARAAFDRGEWPRLSHAQRAAYLI
ncbi:MAG TPA: aldehyde dehydrogenase family protein, partial [Allosphingosinicella sp.]|nr:aldehyde dehydrogenase family protein [Allosphingosinicella sp.]